MTLPVDLTTITVTGTYLTASGAPLGGSVLFAPSVPLTDRTGQVVLSVNPIVAEVSDTTGEFSVVLPTTNNATLLPAGWAYSVRVNVPGAVTSFDAYLPSSWGASVDITQLGPVPVIPTQPGLYVISVNGISGAVTGVLGPGSTAGGDLSGSYPNPAVAATHLSSPLPVNQGGTAATSAGAALTSLGAASAAGLAAETARAEAAEALLVPLSDLPLAIGNGGTGHATQASAITALTGTQSAGKVLRSDGTNATLAAIQVSDIPTLNQSTTGTAGNITSTLDQVPAPAANVSLASHKITSLANGSTATDAAAYGQTPAGGAIVTGQLLASHVYAPGTPAAPTVSSATLGALDTTNLTVSFTAPPSGNVIVTFSGVVVPPSTQVFGFAFAAHGTVTPVVGAGSVMGEVSSSNVVLPWYMEISVTGLTSGNSYQYDLLGAAASGSVAVNCSGTASTTPTGAKGGPATFKVLAA